MAGYIKLHRQLLDSLQFSNPNYLKVWIWMLLKANHKTKMVSLKVSKGYTDVSVGRGQFLFGRNKAEIELNIDGSTIYRILKRFEQDSSISLKSNNQYTLVTICKYEDYNQSDESDEQPMNNRRTTDEQPMNTTKNDKKEKNDKKVYIAPSLEEVKQYFLANGYREEAAYTAFKYYDEADWKDKNGAKVLNWKQKMISVWFKDQHRQPDTTKVETRKMVR